MAPGEAEVEQATRTDSSASGWHIASFSARNWIYLPPTKGEGVTWLIGLLTVAGLAAVQSSAVGKLSYPSLGTLTALILPTLLLVLYDGALLWVHLRPYYPTFSSGRRVFVTTYVVLASVYCAILSAVLVANGRVSIALLSNRSVDAGVTVWCADVGLTGLALALGATAFWKPDTPGFATVWQGRQTIIEVIERVCAQPVAITESEYRHLLPALETLLKDAATVWVRVRRQADRDLLDVWSGAAKSLYAHYDTLGYDDLPQKGRDSAVRSELAKLKRNV